MLTTLPAMARLQAYAIDLGKIRESLRWLSYCGPLDSHDSPRAWARGYALEYPSADGTERCLAIDSDHFAELGAARRAELTRSAFIIDSGKVAVPHYVSGYNPSNYPTLIFLHPYPTNPDGRTRPDGRVIDHAGWFMSARRMYHLRVAAAE